jgi:hypothetical protein
LFCGIRETFWSIISCSPLTRWGRNRKGVVSVLYLRPSKAQFPPPRWHGEVEIERELFPCYTWDLPKHNFLLPADTVKCNFLLHADAVRFHVIAALCKTGNSELCCPCLPRKRYCIVFRFIIEYSSLRPVGSRFYFYMRIFGRSYFGLCWNLRLVIEL